EKKPATLRGRVVDQQELEAEAAKNAADLQKIETQIEQLKAQEEALKAEAAKLAAMREQNRLKMDELRKKQDVDGLKKLADAAAGPSYLELTITTQGALWPITIQEYG